jgi:hypothetical protein
VSALLNGYGRENGVEQAGEARVEILAPQRVQARGAERSLLDHSSLRQHAEVMVHVDLVTSTSNAPQARGVGSALSSRTMRSL